MDLSWRFDGWYRGLPASGPEEGEVALIVVRPASGGRGARETPEAVRITPEEGVVGDKWAASEDPMPGAQVSLMNLHVLRSLAGSDERMALAGDNLIVDLDLSEENLPVGSRLRVGTVTLEVSPIPHQPCGRFKHRFGATAAKKVGRANRTGKRGRGVMTRVVEAGEVHVGDRIRVLGRAEVAGSD